MKPKHKDYVVSISFRNYLKEKTGLPKVMLAHQQMYGAEGISYVGLIPVKKPLPKNRGFLFCNFLLVIDGEYHGVWQMSQLINRFCDWSNSGYTMLDVHIHHLLYVSLARVDELLRSFHDVPVKVYLHDYYNACCNINLMKNEDIYCGGKGFSSENCGDCPSYYESMRVQKKLHALYRRYVHRITFVSPSKTTRDIFLNFHPEYADRIVVIPHQIYDAHYRGNLEPTVTGEKLKIAFLGLPVHHKGWDTWCRLVALANPEKFEFIVFNSLDEMHPSMRKVRVAFSQKNLNAMTEALRNEGVHIAILWSMCPETYSYTCFEAYAANAFILTREGSGNMAEVVRRIGCGLVLNTEEELDALFLSPERLQKAVNSYRAQTPGGPLELRENPEIVALSNAGRPKGNASYLKCRKPVNYLLLALLNFIQKRKNR